MYLKFSHESGSRKGYISGWCSFR